MGVNLRLLFFGNHDCADMAEAFQTLSIDMLRGLVMLLESPIRVPVFHFLNKKHQNLALPLAEEIRKLKMSGAIQKIFRNYYKNSSSGHN